MVLKKISALFLLAIMVVAALGFSVGYYAGYKAGYKVGFAIAPPVVRIGHLSADLHQVPFFLAYSKGWYQEEGIALIRKEYLYGMPEMTAFMRGDLDAGYVGVVPALIAKSQGADLVAIASSNLEGSAIVAKQGIRDVKDLEGKKVGTPGMGSIQDAMMRMVAKRFNITVDIKHYRFSDLPILLEKGEIDAFIDWEPFCAEAVVKGTGYVIYTSEDILPGHQCCILYVSGKMLKEQPDLVKKILKVHVRVLRDVKETSPEEAMKLFSEMTGRPIGTIQEAWKRMKWGYYVDEESTKIFVKSLIEDKMIDPEKVPEVDTFVKSFIDRKTLEEVLEEMGIAKS
jgi:NitT/TauT family transport system substrate-binding protein